jgi:hypothetical protein
LRVRDEAHAAADTCGGERIIREMRERRVPKVCLRQSMAAAIDELKPAGLNRPHAVIVARAPISGPFCFWGRRFDHRARLC